MANEMWCGDNAGYEEPGEAMYRGDATVYSPDEFYPTVHNPIGFMRRKLRVRVKAWTQPIVGDQS